MADYPSDKKRDVGYKFSAGILSTDPDFSWFAEPFGLSPNQLAKDMWVQAVPYAGSGGADTAISSISYITKKDIVLVLEPNTNGTLWLAREGGTLSGNRMRNFINPNNHTNAAGNISLGYTVLIFQSSNNGSKGTSITTTAGSWQFMYKEGAFITDDGVTPSDMGWNTTSTTSGESILHATAYQYHGLHFEPDNNPSNGDVLKYTLPDNGNPGYLEWGSGGSGSGSGEANEMSFKNIAVSGQTTVVADTTTDTLNLVGGTNVTITTNATTDTITFNATGGISLSDITVGTEGTPSGNGSISYDGTTGVITYTPPAFGLDDLTDVTGGEIPDSFLPEIPDDKLPEIPTDKLPTIPNDKLNFNSSNGTPTGVLPAAQIPNIDLTTKVTGTLPVTSGGTGLTDVSTLLNTNTTKTDVGLSNVDNTSDANKPVSNAQQTALDAKAPTANPTFTGTVSGVTAAHVGLGNVENKSSQEIRDDIAAGDIPSLDAAKITTGSFDSARIPNLNADKITFGVFGSARIPTLNTSKIGFGILSTDRGGTGINTFSEANFKNSNVTASDIGSGTFNIDRIPDLGADKITTGTFVSTRIPDLNASKIAFGTLSSNRLPSIPVVKGGTGITDFSEADFKNSNVTVSDISDFDTEVSNNTNVAANTDKRSYPTADENKLSALPTNANLQTALDAKASLTGTETLTNKTINGATIDSTTTIDGTAASTVKAGAAAGSTANQDSTATILSGNLTGSVDGTAVATIKSGAAAGATANQDSTATILSGNLTGSVDGTAVATIKSGAAAGATALQTVPDLDASKITSGSFDVGRIPTITSSKISDIEIGSDKQDVASGVTKVVTGDAVYARANQDDWGVPEGTAIQSTGETGGTKFLREDGDGTCSWQTISTSGGATDIEDLDNVTKVGSYSGNDMLVYDSASNAFKNTRTLNLLSVSANEFNGSFQDVSANVPNIKIASITENSLKHGIVEVINDFIIKLDVGQASGNPKTFQVRNGADDVVFLVDETGGIRTTKFKDTTGNDKIEYETDKVKIHDDIKSVTGKFKDNSDVTRIDYSGTVTKISGDVQYTGSSPATISGPDADKLNIESVDDIDFKIASGGASSKSFKFYNNTNEIASLASNGELQIDGDLIASRKIQLGNSDTTIERTAAGKVSIEGKEIVTVNRVLQQFNLSFTDDIGTTQHYLSWRDQYEQSSISSDLVDTNYLVPANGRVKCVYMRVGYITANSTMTVRVYSMNAGFQESQVQQEAEATSITTSDRFEVFAFYFDDAEHFQAGDSIKISVQNTVDSGGTQIYNVTAVLEFDYTQMGRTDTGELA